MTSIVVDTSEDLRPRLVASEKWALGWMPDSGMTVCFGPCSATFRSVLPLRSERSILVEGDRGVIDNSRVAVCPVVASAARLPFVEGSFDTAILLDTLARGGDEGKMIDEVQRILRPGGKLILAVPNRGLFRLGRTRADGFSLRRYYTAADITRLLFLKFRVIRRHYGGLFLYPLIAPGLLDSRKGGRGVWSRLLEKIADIDNDISWGRWSCNLILLAEKI